MPLYKYAANRLLTFVQNLLVGHKLSEYHTGYRGFTRAVLAALPLDRNSDDFVFDNQMLSQIIYLGFRVGEISCPTSYFSEASSINFRRSVTYGLGVLRTAVEFRLACWGRDAGTVFEGLRRRRPTETLTIEAGTGRARPGFLSFGNLCVVGSYLGWQSVRLAKSNQHHASQRTSSRAAGSRRKASKLQVNATYGTPGSQWRSLTRRRAYPAPSTRLVEPGLCQGRAFLFKIRRKPGCDLPYEFRSIVWPAIRQQSRRLPQGRARQPAAANACCK